MKHGTCRRSVRVQSVAPDRACCAIHFSFPHLSVVNPAFGLGAMFPSPLGFVVLHKSWDDPIHLAWMVKEVEQLAQRNNGIQTPSSLPGW